MIKILFCCYTYTLVVEYDDQECEVQKLVQEAKYTYSTEESLRFSDGKMTGFAYRMDESKIRAMESGHYPVEIQFIGYSGSRKTFVILYLDNQDSYYIDDPLGKSISGHAGWRRVAK